MPLGKRKRVTKQRVARKIKKPTPKTKLSTLSTQISRITRTIETKDQVWKSGTNVALPHNQLHQVLAAGSGGRMNIFQIDVGAGDAMSNGGGRRIGDEITVSRVLLKGMLENALGRPKVNYRIMVVRAAKGDTPSRTTLFRGVTGNKLIDQINTERYTIVAQKVITINSTNPMANTVTSAGVPIEAPQLVTGNAAAGIGSKLFTISIPGKKFFRGGRVRYEDQSATQVKFYDFHIMIMTYDWFGTPDDILGVFNDVGRLNEMYCKVYYKDA